MPISVVLTLRSSQDWVCLGPTGRDAQAWFLNQVEQFRPDLIRNLHDTADLRPYTISGLFNEAWRPLLDKQPIVSQQVTYLRLTGMTDDMVACIQAIQPGLPLTLQHIPFEIQQVISDQARHPWANQQTYGELLLESEKLASLQAEFQFITPTAFHIERSDVPLPIPELILRSWWRKWNQFAPAEMRIDAAWPKFAEACVRVSHMRDVNTSRWKFADGKHGITTGFYGNVSLSLLPPQHCREWQEHWDGAARILHALGAFSIYCGTGHHTTIGLGQTRRLENRQNRSDHRPF